MPEDPLEEDPVDIVTSPLDVPVPEDIVTEPEVDVEDVPELIETAPDAVAYDAPVFIESLPLVAYVVSPVARERFPLEKLLEVESPVDTDMIPDPKADDGDDGD
jgi:hypothetical protein